LAETMVKLAELGWGQDDASFRQVFTSQFIPKGTPEQHRWFNELERVSSSPRNAARGRLIATGIAHAPLHPQAHADRGG
jgi:hypothetical protein